MRRAALLMTPLLILLAGAARATAAEPVPGWVDNHDGGGLFNDDGLVVVSSPQGHALVAGESADGIGGSDLAVRLLDRDDGHELWQTRYEGYDDKDVTVTDVTWDSAGQLIVAGYIRGCVG